MIVYHELSTLPQQKRVVVLGNFDGLHIGHQNLIHQGRLLADAKGASLAVLTFYPQWQSLHNAGFQISPASGKTRSPSSKSSLSMK